MHATQVLATSPLYTISWPLWFLLIFDELSCGQCKDCSSRNTCLSVKGHVLFTFTSFYIFPHLSTSFHIFLLLHYHISSLSSQILRTRASWLLASRIFNQTDTPQHAADMICSDMPTQVVQYNVDSSDTRTRTSNGRRNATISYSTAPWHPGKPWQACKRSERSKTPNDFVDLVSLTVESCCHSVLSIFREKPRAQSPTVCRRTIPRDQTTLKRILNHESIE